MNMKGKRESCFRLFAKEYFKQTPPKTPHMHCYTLCEYPMCYATVSDSNDFRAEKFKTLQAREFIKCVFEWDSLIKLFAAVWNYSWLMANNYRVEFGLLKWRSDINVQCRQFIRIFDLFICGAASHWGLHIWWTLLHKDLTFWVDSNPSFEKE